MTLVKTVRRAQLHIIINQKVCAGNFNVTPLLFPGLCINLLSSTHVRVLAHARVSTYKLQVTNQMERAEWKVPWKKVIWSTQRQRSTTVTGDSASTRRQRPILET